MSTTTYEDEEFGIELKINHSPKEFRKILESLNPEQADNLKKELRSRAANKVLEQYNTKTTTTVVPYSSGSVPLYNIDQVQEAEKGIGLGRPRTGKYAGKEIPKEVLISASLGIPEQNIDLSKGLPTATRHWASLSSVQEEKEKYLEIASGGELKKVNINGVDQLFVFNPDGTLNPIDEKGVSVADFAELSDYVPEALGVLTEIGLVSAYGPAGLAPAVIAGPAVEASAQEAFNRQFREMALNPALKEEADRRGTEPNQVRLWDGSLKRGGTTFALGFGGNVAGNLGGTLLLKTGVVDVLKPSVVADKTGRAIDDLQKEATRLGIDLRLPDIPFGEATMGIIQREDAGRIYLQGMIKRLQDFRKNIYDPEYLNKNKEIFQKDLERIATDQIQYARYIDAELKSIDAKAAATYSDSLKAEIEKLQNLKFSNGEYSFSQGDLSSTYNPFNDSLTRLKDGIYEISGKKYDAVRASIRNNPPKKPIKAQDFFSRMEKKLSPEEMNQFAELYATEIKRTPTLEISGKTAYEDLKKSRGFSLANMNFDSLNRLYRLRGNITFKEGKNLEQKNFYKALKEERLSLLDAKGKQILKEADDYYSNSVDPMKERILGPAFDKFTETGGKQGVKEREALTGVYNVLNNTSGSAVEKFDLAMKLFDEAKDATGKQQYIKSLRGGYLLNNGAFTKTPSSAITNPTKVDLLLRERLFKDQYDGMFDLLKEVHELGGSIGPDLGRQIVDSTSKLSKQDAELLYDQLEVLSRERIQREKRLGEVLFNSTDQLGTIRNQGALARHVSQEKISGDSIEEFLSKFELDIQKDAFKARVMEELFANNQKSGYLFDGEKVIDILKTDEDKYKALFGDKKLSLIKRYADVVARIPKADAKLSTKAAELGNSNLAMTADGGKVRFYYRWLTSLRNNPSKTAKILSLHLQSLGEGAESSLRKSVLEMNPDYLVDEILTSKVMSRTLATDTAIKLLFFQDDPISAELRNDLSVYSSTIIADERSKSPEAILGPE